MSSSASHHQEQRHTRLAELEATRRQIEAYQTLLQEVPTVFERKFRERLQPVLQRNREIAAESLRLREQLSMVLPPSPEAKATALPAGLRNTRPSPRNNPAAAKQPTATATTKKAAPGRPALQALLKRFSPPRGWPTPRSCYTPRSWPRPLLRGGAAIGVLGMSLLALGSLSHHLPMPQLSRLLNLTSADAGAIGPEELQLISKGSWIEVLDASGQPLYAGILEGERRFTIGPGLRLTAGRPDLVTYRIGNRPVVPLGPIEDVGWRTLDSPLRNPAAVPALETNITPQP